jgi:hypothetical protein
MNPCSRGGLPQRRAPRVGVTTIILGDDSWILIIILWSFPTHTHTSSERHDIKPPSSPMTSRRDPATIWMINIFNFNIITIKNIIICIIINIFNIKNIIICVINFIVFIIINNINIIIKKFSKYIINFQKTTIDLIWMMIIIIIIIIIKLINLKKNIIIIEETQ